MPRNFWPHVYLRTMSTVSNQSNRGSAFLIERQIGGHAAKRIVATRTRTITCPASGSREAIHTAEKIAQFRPAVGACLLRTQNQENVPSTHRYISKIVNVLVPAYPAASKYMFNFWQVECLLSSIHSSKYESTK